MVPKKKAGTNSAYKKTTLKNGLRIVTEQMPSVRSVSLGVWVDVGSRFESSEESGLTHFIEHMLFKGTKKRSAKQIATEIESIGGVLNAFTSKEQTCYVVRILDEHLETAVTVLSDMLLNSTLTPANLKREKQVICEEIKESIDNPSDNIHDLFSTAFWGDHPIGRPIMGDIDNIQNMPRKRMADYIGRNYKAGSIVISAAGSVSHAKLVKMVRERFELQPGQSDRPLAAEREKLKNLVTLSNDNNQTHLSLGFPGLSYSDKDRMTTMVTSLYLGGGMSSVLFQKIREEKGLAYSVYTFHDSYRDSGIFGAYLGTDKKHLKQALDITLKEFHKLTKNKLSSLMVQQAKSQLKGHIMLGMESTYSRMNRLARHELMYGKYYTLSETIKEIEAVTPSAVLKLANKLFDRDRLAIAVLGPTEKNELKGI